MPLSTQDIEISRMHTYKEWFILFPTSHGVKNERVLQNGWASSKNILEGQRTGVLGGDDDFDGYGCQSTRVIT